MKRFAYGRRRPRRRPFHAAFAMAAALDALGPPPPESIDYASAAAPLFGGYRNDVLADCVAVDTANALILRTATASGVPVVPTVDQVVSLYSAVAGYVVGDPTTDNGTDEVAMGQHLVETGFLGHKAAAFGPVDHLNLDHVRWAQLLFGTCRLCWNLPGYAEDLFDDGKPWDLRSGGDQSTDGHDTAMVDYRDGLIYVVSWFDQAGAYPRRLVPVTPAFAMKHLDAAQAEIFPDWIKAQGVAPSGLDLTALVAKLGDVA